MTFKLLACVNGGATQKKRKFKSKNFVNKKDDELHFVHTELKLILGNANRDFFYQRVTYMGLPLRVGI